MRDTFKKILTAATFAMLIVLPLGAQAIDENIKAATNTAAKGSVKEILSEIRSVPRSIDGQVTKSTKAIPFVNQDNDAAGCLVCINGICVPTC